MGWRLKGGALCRARRRQFAARQCRALGQLPESWTAAYLFMMRMRRGACIQKALEIKSTCFMRKVFLDDETIGCGVDASSCSRARFRAAQRRKSEDQSDDVEGALS